VLAFTKSVPSQARKQWPETLRKITEKWWRMSAFNPSLPPGAVVVEASSATFWGSGLMSVENQYISQALEKRKREFTAGRNCARQALMHLGFPPLAIAVGASREPLFPPDVSGTITHSADYCAAAVIRRGDVLSIGIDADTTEPLDAAMTRLGLRPEEQHANIAILPSENVFEIRVLKTDVDAYFQTRSFRGQYVVDGLHIYGAMALPASMAPSSRARAGPSHAETRG
jgi:hypothetical protein